MSDAAEALRPLALPPSADEEDVAAPSALSLRGIGGVLLSSRSGKAAIVMFIAILGISIYVLATYPRDFGASRWSSPLVWADNPKTAPPSWTRFYDDQAIEHQVMVLTEPGNIETRGPAEVRDFDAVID